MVSASLPTAYSECHRSVVCVCVGLDCVQELVRMTAEIFVVVHVEVELSLRNPGHRNSIKARVFHVHTVSHVFPKALCLSC